jgi:bis(5'-nucleosidyl)-tetraphosphatase
MRHLQSAGIIIYRPSTQPSLKTTAGTTGRANGNNINYLLLQYAHGHWDFVKGKIEMRENKQEAALRELKEETGITSITIDPDFSASFSYIYTEVDGIVTKKTVHFFIGCTPETQITLSPEHKDYAWLPFEKAVEQLTFENAQEMLRTANKFIQNM